MHDRGTAAGHLVTSTAAVQQRIALRAEPTLARTQ